MQFLGRLHILILHLPIGIFILTLLLEWINYLKWQKIDRSTLTLTYGIGSVFTLGACLSGFVLYQGEGYEFDLVKVHLWCGLLAMALSFGVFYLSVQNNKRVFLAGNMLTVIIAVTGHFGGSITHGEDFLSFNSGLELDTISPLVIDDIAEANIFEDVLQYSINTKCVSCHGPQNVKGKLRLDQPEFILAGGKSKIDLLATKDNEILRRIHLPESHKNHMPPDHKRQLSESEIKVWESWVNNGAIFDQKIKDLKEGPIVQQWVEEIIEESNKTDESILKVIPAYLPESNKIKPIAATTLREMESLGFVVLPAGENSSFLEINTINIDTLTSMHWMLLEKSSDQIIRLKLSDHSLETTNFTIIAKMSSLVRLYLDNCNVKDGELSKLKNLEELRYLNISENPNVSSDGLKELELLPNLEKVYAFQTNLNQDIRFQNFGIETGNYKIPFLVSDTVRIE